MTAPEAPTNTRRALDELLVVARARAAEQLSRDVSVDDAAAHAALASVVDRVTTRAGPRAASDGITRVLPRAIGALRSALLQVVSGDGMRVDARDLATTLSELARLEAECEARTAGDPHATDTLTGNLGGADFVTALIAIAHDMRSPLASILFLVDTLRHGQSGPVTPVQERQLGLIYGAALGLSSLASDVIDAVRGGHRLVDGPPVPFSIGEVVTGVCDTVRPISEEKGIPLELSLRAADGRIGYPAALGRVLLNLVTNALKYTAAGTVTVGCQETTADRVLFRVKDTGPGIPQHLMPMLFDGFRPSTSGVRFSNAGLGLAICRSFLASMHSALRVESSPETGTAFSFELALPRA